MTEEIKKSAIPLRRWSYAVRPGDRYDKGINADAHTVIAEFHGQYVKEIATFSTKQVAVQVAYSLNQWAETQIR